MKVILWILILAVFSYAFIGLFKPPKPEEEKPYGTPVEVLDPQANVTPKKALQLRSLIGITHTPTPTVRQCRPGDKVAVDLLLDTSSSMNDNNKIGKLKEAVIAFVSNLQPDDVLGLQVFNSGARNILSPNLFSYYQSSIPSTINGLNVTATTSMRLGFEVAKQEIDQARPNFPDYEWVLIFLTDGIPTNPITGALDYAQEPTDVAIQLDRNTRIITIGLDLGYYASQGRPDLTDYAIRLLDGLPGDFHQSPSGAALQAIYQSIAHSICR